MSAETAVRTTTEVANRLVEHCRVGQFVDAINELYADDVKSHEMPGAQAPELTEGKEGVLAKNHQWAQGVQEVHRSEVSDPLVAGDHFTVRFDMDITFKDGNRIPMVETGVYQVNNGHVVREQFFYSV